jgi:hypothetical protein
MRIRQRRPDRYARLRTALRSPDQPLPVDEVVKFWADHHFNALVKIAFGILRDAPNTAYTLPLLKSPALTIVGFGSEESRQQYNAQLYQHLKRDGRVTVKDLYDEHVTRFVAWIRTQQENDLAGLLVERTYRGEAVATKETT